MNTDTPWHGVVDRAQALSALAELGQNSQDLYLEHELDALTIGAGDGAILRTVTIPCQTVFQSPTDRYKHHGLRFYAVLPSQERALLFHAIHEHPDLTFKLKVWSGMLQVERNTLVPTTLDLTKMETRPTRIIRNLLNSPHKIRIGMNPVHLANLIQPLRPIKNNDAILVGWGPKNVTMTGLEKSLDDNAQLQVTPHVLSLEGACRKKSPFPGHTAINSLKRNAVKVDGDRLCQALAWMGNCSKGVILQAGHEPPAIVLRRNDNIARHALLMMQRFLPEEVAYIDNSTRK